MKYNFPNAVAQGEGKPRFKETGDFFDIEFIRTEYIESDSIGGEIGGEIGGKAELLNLTERQLVVLQVVEHNPTISQSELADQLGINPSAVQKHLEKLKQAGVIERIGGTRGYWKIKQNLAEISV